jgi:predicted transcriptional regulator
MCPLQEHGKKKVIGRGSLRWFLRSLNSHLPIVMVYQMGRMFYPRHIVIQCHTVKQNLVWYLEKKGI